MSTRCVIGFYGTHPSEGKPEALIYRHGDGYPDGKHGVPASLARLFVDVAAQTSDTRFDDPSYLAAKYVVWQAGEYASDKAKPLAFLSLGIVMNEPGDIEYRYAVVCLGRRGTPAVYWQGARGGDWELANGEDTNE